MQRISIPWSWLGQPLPMSEYRSWHRFSELPLPSAEEESTARAFGWNPAVLSFLQSAFAAELPRRIGWDPEGVADVGALKIAASLFRRGVAVRGNASVPLSGASEIFFERDPWVVPAADIYFIDAQVYENWDEVRKLKPGIVVHTRESEKTLTGAAKIFQRGKEHATWCVLGGGLLSDLCGFAAGLCGAHVTFVPTTLLAMVDATVGGKTGVNFPPYGKNQLGLFYFPKRVEIASRWLSSLADSEWFSGAGEVLKHAFLRRPDLLATLVPALRQRNLRVLAAHLHELVKVKADIVSRDPFENGERATLNFGHTWGHALETLSNRFSPLPHGEAVAWGMLFAGLLSRKLARLSGNDFAKLEASLKNAGCLRSDLLKLFAQAGGIEKSWRELLALMQQDKKNEDGVQFALITELGKPSQYNGRWTCAVSAADLQEVWNQMISLCKNLNP